jgi:hypothetical protein
MIDQLFDLLRLFAHLSLYVRAHKLGAGDRVAFGNFSNDDVVW